MDFHIDLVEGDDPGLAAVSFSTAGGTVRID